MKYPLKLDSETYIFSSNEDRKNAELICHKHTIFILQKYIDVYIKYPKYDLVTRQLKDEVIYLKNEIIKILERENDKIN